MRKQFARLFIGFLLVIIVMIAIQVTVLFLSGMREQCRWNQDIYQGYVQALSSALATDVPKEGWSIDNLDRALLSSADNRVSGLLLKNISGEVVTTFGKTRNGIPMQLPDKRKHPDENMKEGTIRQLDATTFHTVTAKTDLYVIAVSQSHIGLSDVFTSVLYKDKSERKQILLPGNLKARDIAGSISILVNGVAVANVDVIAFSPFAYQPMSRFLGGIVTPLLWSIPFALVVALWMGAKISKRNQKYTQGIQSALKDLSEGKHDVAIPQTTVEENLGINQSIRDLDKQLLRHELSRREWLRSITHDLNTPVSSMKLLLDGMSDGVFPINQKGMLMIKKENDELAERINAVVLYSKLLSPDAKADLQQMDVAEFVDLVSGQFSSDVWKRVKVDASQADLTGDQDKLLVACKELLKNALKASTEDVLWMIGRNSMVFTNTGELPENVDFFEPWTKGDQSRGSTGNGLGLPIVQQVMNLHKGKASIKSIDEKVVVEIAW